MKLSISIVKKNLSVLILVLKFIFTLQKIVQISLIKQD